MTNPHRDVHRHAREAEEALRRALEAAAGDVPPRWAVDLAKAREFTRKVATASRPPFADPGGDEQW